MRWRAWYQALRMQFGQTWVAAKVQAGEEARSNLERRRFQVLIGTLIGRQEGLYLPLRGANQNQSCRNASLPPHALATNAAREPASCSRAK